MPRDQILVACRSGLACRAISGIDYHGCTDVVAQVESEAKPWSTGYGVYTDTYNYMRGGGEVELPRGGQRRGRSGEGEGRPGVRVDIVELDGTTRPNSWSTHSLGHGFRSTTAQQSPTPRHPHPVTYTSQTAVFKLTSAESGEEDSYVLSANGKGYTSGVSYALGPVSSRECTSSP